MRNKFVSVCLTRIIHKISSYSQLVYTNNKTFIFKTTVTTYTTQTTFMLVTHAACCTCCISCTCCFYIISIGTIVVCIK